MLDPALVNEAHDQLARTCVTLAKLADGATPDEKQTVQDMVYAVTEASRMLMQLTGPRPSQ